MTTSPRRPTTKEHGVTAQAKAVVAELKRLVAELPLDDGLTSRDMARAKVTARVPRKAMEIAIAVLAEDPGIFPELHVEEMREALAYVDAMVAVGEAARRLADRATRSALKRRAAMARETLALYQIMKGTARLPQTETTRRRTKELASLFTTRKASRSTTVTKKEEQAIATALRKAKKAALAQAEATKARKQADVASARAAIDAARAATPKKKR